MDPPVIIKVYFIQPDKGTRHFSLDSGNLITDSSIPGVSNGDHLLFFNDINLRGYGDDQLMLISGRVLPKKLVSITVLKAENNHPEYLGYLLNLIAWTTDVQ
jgi:hypothetical protein